MKTLAREKLIRTLKSLMRYEKRPCLAWILAINELLDYINDKQISDLFKKTADIYQVMQDPAIIGPVTYKMSIDEKQVLIDPLTGCYNRRALDKDIIRYRELVQRHRATYGLGVIDIDDLKVVNDKHGHEAGDKLIKAVAETLQKTIRATDKVYRIGGDEFVIIFSHFEECKRTKNRVMRALKKAKLSVSMGCAIMSEHAFAEADRRMYCQKMQHKKLKKICRG